MLALESRSIQKGEGHAAGRALLAEMYRKLTGEALPPIAVAERGKPCFTQGGIHFSISHTKTHVFCALSDKPIGIDAEPCDRAIRRSLAAKILSPREQERLQAAADPQAALLRLWVLKEAAAKCTGEGLRGYPNHTDFSPDDLRVQVIDGCFVAVIEED